MIQQLFRYPQIKSRIFIQPRTVDRITNNSAVTESDFAQRNLRVDWGDFSHLFIVSGFPHFATTKKPKTPTLW